MMVVEDEDMVEHLAPEGAGEPLRDRVHVGRPDCRLDDPNGRPNRHGRRMGRVASTGLPLFFQGEK
jgi:hypothetical protein